MGAKFKVIFVADENGKPVRKFVPENDERPGPEYANYGDYVITDAEHIQEAKEKLLDGMHEVLRNLSEKDEFWIVRAGVDGSVSVGWMVNIPHMDKLNVN